MKSGCEGREPKAKKSIQLPILKNSPTDAGGIRRSRVGRWRAGVLIALNLLMVAHVLQWWLTGSTVSPIEPSESMYTLQQGAVNAGVIFFSLAILATLIFGRFVCGWGCHIVALQDLCAWMLKKAGIKPRPFRSRLLVFIPVAAALYMFVWPTVSRALTKPAGEPLLPQFTNHIVTTDFWATFPPVAVAIPFLFIVGFMTVYFLGSKGFCTYGCPYGGVFGIADKIAPGKIRVTDACNQCGHCTAVCTSNVLVHAEVKEYGMVVDPGCMKCMDCVSVCPNDALYFGFGKPAVGVPKTIERNYSLSWAEEVFGAIVFVASYFAVWNVYQLVPMLMAIGIAIITTFLALKVLRLATSPDVSFYGRSLRSGGAIRSAGWAFLAFAIAWIGLTTHSGYVRYHESAGTRAFENLRIPDELALAQAAPEQWLSLSDRAFIADGKKELQKAAEAGLFVNSEALPKLAWLEYLSGNAERAVQLLASASENQSGQAKAVSLYYRGAILNRLGRSDEAIASLDEALKVSPDLITAHEERGESMWQLGRRQEAAAAWNEAVRRNAGLPLANNFLAGAVASTGRPEEAAAYESQADKFTPRDPYFHWMLGLRLQNVGMEELAEKHFSQAIKLNPEFRGRRNVGSRPAPSQKKIN